MDRIFVQRMKDELERQRDQLVRLLASETEGFRQIVEDEDPKDLIDMASDDVDKTNIEALNVVEARRLQQIEGALARIRADRYGICMECSQFIPHARLEALPWAVLCVPCQEKRDKLNR
jgi:RNA polymerase-binding transcription factor DksA